jgi:hypothetical protein
MPDDPPEVKPGPTPGGADAALAEAIDARMDQFLASRFAELEKQLQDRAPPVNGNTSWWDRFSTFFASGIFFVCLGAGFLTVAFRTMGGVHGAFSFVLVVLGVAILLYGTGTHGMGSFYGDQSYAKYRIALAGGAGVLAFATGFGMALYGKQMQDVFDIENKHLMVFLMPTNDGLSGNETTIGNYMVQFYVDGTPIPSMADTNKFVGFIPYRDRDVGHGKRLAVTYRLYAKEQKLLDRSLAPSKEGTFVVVLDKNLFNDSHPGVDLPVYEPPEDAATNTQSGGLAAFRVDLKSADTVVAVLDSAGRQKLENVFETSTVAPTENALVLGQ